MALIGTHRIGYRVLQGIRPTSSVAMPFEVEFQERSYFQVKRFGTDKWELAVGETLDQLLHDATKKCTPKPGTRVVIHGLEMLDFSMGLFQWSPHLVNV